MSADVSTTHLLCQLVEESTLQHTDTHATAGRQWLKQCEMSVHQL